MTLIGKAVQRRLADLLLAAEAAVLLMIFKLCLALLPVRRILGAVTRGRRGEVDAARSDETIDFARRVQWAVSAVARHSIVGFVCFPQALAAYVMLRSRGVASTIVYGVARSGDDELMAHTWLMVGDAMVVGGEAAAEFTEVDRWS
jgi:hypothetical protein